MRIAFFQGSLRVSEFPDQGALEGALSRCQLGQIKRGGVETALSQFLVRIRPDENSPAELGIAVMSESADTLPELYLGAPPGYLWIGYNCALAIVNVAAGTLLNEEILESPFYDFIPVPDHGLVVVVYETGLWCFNASGEKRWQYASNVVQEVRLVSHQLLVEFMDEPSVRLSVLTGQVRPA